MTEEQVAERYATTVEEVQAITGPVERNLLKRRSTRVRPHLDDKVLTSWNALMISAFAKAAQVLGDSSYAQVARRAVDFLRANLWREQDQLLLRRFRDGEAAVDGFLDDYALLALALLDLYETAIRSGRFQVGRHPGTSRDRSVRRPATRRVLFHRRRQGRPGAAAQGRLRWSGTVGKFGHHHRIVADRTHDGR